MEITHIATICFALAIIHTFLCKRFQILANSYPEGSVKENLFHLLGEVEVVFGFWAGIYLLLFTWGNGVQSTTHYLESLNFTEPAFVFAIMTVCATKPVMHVAFQLIQLTSRLLPLPRPTSVYFVTLTLGPLLGSFITEPAAMTVTALVLREYFYLKGVSEKFMYATLGLLFVSVSIGGTLTPYAAPPVLMVAGKWNWDIGFMMTNFGWKGAVAIFISTAFVTWRFRKELAGTDMDANGKKEEMPIWISFAHILALALIVLTAHHMVLFIGLFLFFLGLTAVTKEFQNELKLRESLLVGFFLGGLVILGTPQRWWLEPLLTQLSTLPLYFGATTLTAITDNAALTYLGAQVPTLSEASKYALVAGAVVGGGLTVIANAPNPAGFGILNPCFKESGISPLGLFLSALPPTLVALILFWPV